MSSQRRGRRAVVSLDFGMYYAAIPYIRVTTND
jgi:hypothetical protein